MTSPWYNNYNFAPEARFGVGQDTDVERSRRMKRKHLGRTPSALMKGINKSIRLCIAHINTSAQPPRHQQPTSKPRSGFSNSYSTAYAKTPHTELLSPRSTPEPSPPFSTPSPTPRPTAPAHKQHSPQHTTPQPTTPATAANRTASALCSAIHPLSPGRTPSVGSSAYAPRR